MRDPDAIEHRLHAFCMRPEDLHLFSRQLALWAESAITRGRTPFRRVETSPTLLSAAGEVRPALVLWINRDSFMAGGVLLLPPAGGEPSHQKGHLCARALGLRHFATWDPKEIVVWEDQGKEIRRHRTLDLPAPPGAEDFRFALERLLEEFKLLSVLGSVPAQELSHHYFANLARATLEGAFGALTESVRVAQAERRLPASLCPFDHARRKSALVLLRLLVLLLQDRLPTGIQPENLEKAMLFALEEIAEPLRDLLLPAQEELPLCSEAAVRFHHLLRRLGQLRFGEDPTRAAQVLELFLSCEASRLGGHPLPDSAPSGDTLLLHPDRLVACASVAAEISSLPLLALGTLLRTLRGETLPKIRRQSVFDLSREEVPAHIVGTLNDRSLPSAAQRPILLGHLRASWPNRRFPLPPHTPWWAWELLHLLGLAPEGSQLYLNVPAGWLCSDFAATLVTVLREGYTLSSLRHSEHHLTLAIRREASAHSESRLLDLSAEETILSWAKLQSAPLPLCCLVLAFPSCFSRLLEREEPIFDFADSADWSGQHRQILRFAHSFLGRHLWKIASGGAPLPSPPAFEREAKRVQWPVLSADILERLDAVATPPGGENAEFDRELARLTGLPSDFTSLLRTSCSPSSSRNTAPRGLARSVAATVFADGIPLFPEQYLYDYYRPELQVFSFTGALRIEENFFGEITLCDSRGVKITVEGEECAKALELASYSGRTPVYLPRDLRITGEILDRYLHDLRHLQQMLLRQTHLKAADTKAADALAQRIWKSLPLPPWSVLER